MSGSLEDKLMEVIREKDPSPYLYKKGQIARIKNGVSNDGQTPKHWDGAKVVILSQHSSPLFKQHWYEVIHMENSHTCDFKEEELDRRFCKRNVI